jgi:hypothetical protein
MRFRDDLRNERRRKVRVDLDRDGARAFREGDSIGEICLVIDRLNPGCEARHTLRARDHPGVFHEIRSREQSRIIEIGPGNFGEPRRSGQLRESAQVITHAARRGDAAIEIAAHHGLGKLPIRRRSQVLVGVDETRERILAFHVKDFSAHWGLQFGLRNNGFDSLATRDDRHIGPNRPACAIDDRRAHINDHLVFCRRCLGRTHPAGQRQTNGNREKVICLHQINSFAQRRGIK